MEREAFLARVASSLGRNGQPPNSQSWGNRTETTTGASAGVRGAPEFYRARPLGDSSADPVERFIAEFEGVGGRVARVDSVEEAGGVLRSLVEELTVDPDEGGSVLTWARSEFDGWGIDWLWNEKKAIEVIAANEIDLRSSLTVPIGVTTVDFAVANTGTLIVTVSPARARSVSLIPTTHIALVREEQIVDRSGEAFASIGAGESMPSAFYCITGPSRSADIENDLTIGVHGPAALYVILLK
jgi:L-lactate dehydrogenase complex protein LldG